MTMRQHTPRQEKVITLILEGLSNQQIADKIGVKLATVQGQVNKLYLKYNLEHATGKQKRVELAVILYQERHGINSMTQLATRESIHVDLGSKKRKGIQ
jgi:DNA-binding NarL/FixJ family response regulator